MRRAALVILLVLAHLAVTLAVPPARAAKAFGPTAPADQPLAADTSVHHGTQPVGICPFGAGVLACPYFVPAETTVEVPAVLGTAVHPYSVEPLPTTRSVPTPLRPPRLST